MRGWPADLDGDGTYTFTGTLPPGSYKTKVAHTSWAENYGADGARDGADIGFDVPAEWVQVVFTYDVGTHRLQVSTRSAGTALDLTKARAHWLRRDSSPGTSRSRGRPRYRLHRSQAGDLGVDAEAVTGGSSAPSTHDPAGLPADVLADFLHLAGYEASGSTATPPAACRTS